MGRNVFPWKIQQHKVGFVFFFFNRSTKISLSGIEPSLYHILTMRRDLLYLMRQKSIVGYIFK